MLFALALTGCMKVPGTPADFTVGLQRELSPPAVVCEDPTLGPGDFCMPATIEPLLRDAPMVFLDGETFGTGISGVMKMRVELQPEERDPFVVDVKWKPAPRKLSMLNNSPRKEVATYQIQKLFMAPERFVIPPTVMRCVQPRPHHVVERKAGGDELPCVWGMLALWVEGIEPPGVVDAFRLEEDPDYLTTIADLNLLLYVIDHHDPHNMNWFLSKDPRRVRALSVDNGMTFSGIRNPRLSTNWAEIHVPALPADSIRRLRAVTDDDLASLAVLGAWRVGEETLIPVDDAPVPDDDGVQLEDGLLVHGLTPSEIRRIRERIDDLLVRVDAGEIRTFEPGDELAALERPFVHGR